MKSIITKSIVIILSIFFISCGSNTNSEKELELKAKELELKERELNLREKNITEANGNDNEGKTTDVRKKNMRELRYLYFSNGGLIGYFDDGTIAGCPRCDFMKSNVVSMFDAKPNGTYTVGKDGSLLVNGNQKETPTNADDGWALIDYNWKIKPTQD